MILVTGATGHIGGAVIRQLLQKTPASQIVALVRDESKATALIEKGVQIRLGDYDNTESLDNAMQGIGKVLLVSGGGANGLQQHYNVVDAAKKANVACLAYTGRSLQDRHTLVNPLMVRHFQTEDYIKASGLNYILFRNSLYMDTIPVYVGQAVLDTGIVLPAGEGKVAFALRSEMGEAIANVLADTAGVNQVYQFTGSSACTYHDVAAALTALSGKPVNYTPLTEAGYETRMNQAGVPAMRTRIILDFMADIKNGQEAAVSPDLERMLGRKPASLTDGVKVLFQF